MHESEQSWAEVAGPRGLAPELQETFLAAGNLLGLPAPDLGLPEGWVAAAEHLLALRGEATLREIADGCKAAYVEEARLPADARVADPLYDLCWQAVVLLAHGALTVDPEPEDRRGVHQRVREYVLTQAKRCVHVQDARSVGGGDGAVVAGGAADGGGQALARARDGDE